MILVMLGTQKNSFYRLLEEIQKCIDKKVINEEVVVQAGSTKFKSKDMKIFDLISTRKLNKLIKESNYVITHGGVGSIVTCLKMGKKVIAVPRFHKYEEHVNDHQLQIIQTFDGQGFIKGISQVSDLESAIKNINNFEPAKFMSNTNNIIKIIENFIDNKKILFAAYSLDIGGIEKALVNLANTLQTKGYDVTLVLEKKQGIFLNELNKNINVIEYTPSDSKNIIKRKIENLIKRIRFIRKYKNKFDFSASFATYSISSSFVSRISSKNNALWGHADYLTLFNNNKKEVKSFFKKRKYTKFRNIIFVSEEGLNSFLEVFPKMKNKTIMCNNLINNNKIQKLADEIIEMQKDNEVFTFLNVGRHDERQKKLTRIITASEKLKKENLKFKVLFVGDGPDSNLYKQQVKDKKLEENIIFLGSKQNPYPYFKISDCVILTSDYEGYPVVFLESLILNKPIITTKVSDYKDIEGKYGLVTDKDADDIYEKMKFIIKNGYKIEETFNINKYNEEIIKKLEKIF